VSESGRTGNERYSIGAIARAAGVTTQTIRLWEKRGLITSVRSKGGRRLFTSDALRRAAELAANSRRSRRAVARSEPASDIMGLASIGMRIRRVRIDQGLSQAAAARRIGISRSFLATVERGESGVSTRVLAKFADAFGIPMSWFASAKNPDSRVMRCSERPRTLLAGGVTWEELVAPGSHDLEPAMLFVPPGQSAGGVFVRPGEAFVLVLDGTMEFQTGERMESVRLNKGDTLIVDSGTAFSWRNPGRSTARCVWIEFIGAARRKSRGG
jgi:transcriptional regulator with XRE-family HTH domain